MLNSEDCWASTSHYLGIQFVISFYYVLVWHYKSFLYIKKQARVNQSNRMEYEENLRTPKINYFVTITIINTIFTKPSKNYIFFTLITYLNSLYISILPNFYQDFSLSLLSCKMHINLSGSANFDRPEVI